MSDEQTPKTEEQNLLERLQNDIDETGWDLLEEHHKRDALFLLTSDLELAPVGMAMARDEVEYIRGWLNDGKMSRPTDELIKTWLENEVKFNYLIVQPYVLIQLKSEDLQ
ncbi:DUF2288 family protein [Bacteriovorax sp. DB6_IX]|uniref:DUF2288 family protein n=1 Tax=Bacteriovorax sp. DB6_IX TaxID=1353530 RepID=UPI00038A1EC9|nr:DUF2288 family protein [Bacteriovorax sp. DB6_IX]EQC51617.1 PF10052 family protein [Bacteriovorax sp. DB6_IX]